MTKVLVFILSISLFSIVSAQSNLDFEDGRNKDNVFPSWQNATDATEYGAPLNLIKYNHYKDRDVYARIKTVYWENGNRYGLDTLAGTLLQQAEIDYRPSSVSFKYRSFPMQGDEILFGLQLTSYNHIYDSTIVVAEAFFNSNEVQSEWTDELLNIHYYSKHLPDSIHIIATSSANINYGDGSHGYAKVGSEFHLDDIEISGIEFADEETLPSYYVNVFPNPAKSYINVDSNSPDVESIEVYDINGKLVLKSKIRASEKTTIDISMLNSGTYIYKVTGTNTVITTNKFTVTD